MGMARAWEMSWSASAGVRRFKVAARRVENCLQAEADGGGGGDVRQEGVGVAVIGQERPGGPERGVGFAGGAFDEAADVEEGGGHAFGGLEAGGVEGGAEDLADGVEDKEGGGDDGEGAFVEEGEGEVFALAAEVAGAAGEAGVENDEGVVGKKIADC